MYCSVNERCQPDSLNPARHAQIRSSASSGLAAPAGLLSAQPEASKWQNRTRAPTEALKTGRRLLLPPLGSFPFLGSCQSPLPGAQSARLPCPQSGAPPCPPGSSCVPATPLSPATTSSSHFQAAKTHLLKGLCWSPFEFPGRKIRIFRRTVRPWMTLPEA